jgi:hypothetical protein
LRGKTLVIVLLGAVLVAFGGIVALGLTGGSRHVPKGAPGISFTAEPPADGRGPADGAGAAPR